METSQLKKFAQYARRYLIEQVTSKVNLVLAADSAARRESPQAVSELEKHIKESGQEQLIEKVAYTWFNRFCALRFMDANQYNPVLVVSPLPGQFQPEILAEAKAGQIDENLLDENKRKLVFDLLSGKAPSRDGQAEAYRLLVAGVCNQLNKAMPYLFEYIADYTELLMPDDLLSGNSILAYTREAMTPEACQDVEVIGWLYQFYISEKKDKVFDDLKKNKKITPDNIPAATQLFTPHWIVRYLVENSLGRLWLLNRPNSKLVEQMEYYIKPEQPETDFLRIEKPEDIKICDPACGSGHMLTYAFDLLYAIYEEEGYDPSTIPENILKHNLYGIEIDERAGDLAAFALTMKARAKQRRFLNKGIEPNICVLEKVTFTEQELEEYIKAVGKDFFTLDLRETLKQFEEADNFGSLIKPVLNNAQDVLAIFQQKDVSGSLFLKDTHSKVLKVLKQADYLNPKYHVVIANPPYMGGKGMNPRLNTWAKENYPNSKSDLFAMFMERNIDLAKKHGAVAMITMQSWMFLSSFEALRAGLLEHNTLLTMAHLGARAFDSIGGEVVSTSAFVLENANRQDYKGSYLKLVAGNSETEKEVAIREAVMNSDCGWLFYASATDFKKIPGSPIAYWVIDAVRSLFDHPKLGELSETRLGMATANNDLFMRSWGEVSYSHFMFSASSRSEAESSGHKWFPYQKGGDFRKWYGNLDYLVNWKNDGEAIRNFVNPETGKVRSHNYNLDYIFREGVTWNALTSFKTSARISKNSLFDNAGSSLFAKDATLHNVILAFLNSNLIVELISLISPTLNYQPGDIGKLPAYFDVVGKADIQKNTESLIGLASNDWDSYETSWFFTRLPLLNPDYYQPNLKATYLNLRAYWREMTLEMQRLEEENNRIFIDAYGLQDELKPDVPLNEITLTCNPYYRYGSDKTEEELEALLLADTMRELVSYAVGCMFGRYSLDKPGLILANQGETIDDYLKQIPKPTFAADKDNVIPMLEGDWFSDDIAERFRQFLRITFGDEHYEDNLRFVEMALGKNGKPRDIKDYLLKDFYSDHVRRYKKRPIYWMFSSPKGSFNALIYMHRYRPDTVSVVLNDYLREFRTKLTAKKDNLEQISISLNADQKTKTQALKEIEKIKKILDEVNDYERDVLYPLATRQIEIDLDDGVKVNYLKFDDALKTIPGLAAKDEE